MNAFRLSVIALVLVIYSVVCIGAASAPELTARAVKITGDSEVTKVEIEFDQIPQVSVRLLSAPNRLVLDMPESLFVAGKVLPPENSLVVSFRAGLIQEGRSRIVIAASGPIAYDPPAIIRSPDQGTYTYAITIKKSTDLEFARTIEEQILTTSSTTTEKGDRVIRNQSGSAKAFTLVIDPGHGGIDGGATGEKGSIEKDLTLQFAKELKAYLQKTSSIKVFLTRESDQFISLDERVRVARQLNADLFISVHADTIADNSLRGATVYTLSEKASDEVSKAVALQENLSDAIGGVEVAVEDKTVADILIDLTRRETAQHSVGFARSVVEALQKKTILIHNPHRSAGFRVLRAADIPSVLVELGYLSNIEDERQINDPNWREGVMGELARAINIYAKNWQVARQ